MKEQEKKEGYFAGQKKAKEQGASEADKAEFTPIPFSDFKSKFEGLAIDEATIAKMYNQYLRDNGIKPDKAKTVKYTEEQLAFAAKMAEESLNAAQEAIDKAAGSVVEKWPELAGERAHVPTMAQGKTAFCRRVAGGKWEAVGDRSKMLEAFVVKHLEEIAKLKNVAAVVKGDNVKANAGSPMTELGVFRFGEGTEESAPASAKMQGKTERAFIKPDGKDLKLKSGKPFYFAYHGQNESIARDLSKLCNALGVAETYTVWSLFL